MKRILHFILLLLASGTLYSQDLLISDFDNIGTQAFTPFNGNWNGGDPLSDQFVQGANFISITSVNGGNPAGDGSFDATLDGGSPLDFTNITHLKLVARLDAGNQVGMVLVEIRDSNFDVIGTSQFATASYSSSFSSQDSSFVFTGDGVASDATYWRLAGDGIAGDNIRMSFDELATTPEPPAIPEPSTVSLLVVSLVGFAIARRRSAGSCLSRRLS